MSSVTAEGSTTATENVEKEEGKGTQRVPHGIHCTIPMVNVNQISQFSGRATLLAGGFLRHPSGY